MNKNTGNFIKGMGIGMAAGGALVTIGKIMWKKNPGISKGTAKAVHAIGEFAEGIQTMFK